MPTPVKLDDLLCFDLYSASHAVTSWYRPLLDELGLTYAQYLVLVVLWDADAVTIKTIGEALKLDYGTLTPLLRRMERAGLVTRSRSTDDERRVEIALTDAGRALEERGRDVHRCLRDALGLSREEAEILQRALRRVRADVRSAPRASVA